MNFEKKHPQKNKHVLVPEMEQKGERDHKARNLPYVKKDSEEKIGKEKGFVAFSEIFNIFLSKN